MEFGMRDELKVEPVWTMEFCDAQDRTVGELRVGADGRASFVGDADESAEKFLRFVGEALEAKFEKVLAGRIPDPGLFGGTLGWDELEAHRRGLPS